MKKLILKSSLSNLNTELIGNGGNSRLDIMLDKSTHEVWADEFYDHEENSWKTYDDNDIISVGTAKNAVIEDENGEDDPDGHCYWSIIISDPQGNQNNDIIIAGDYYNDNYDVDEILNAIEELYLNDDETETL